MMKVVLKIAVLAACLPVMCSLATRASAADKQQLTFLTNWKAQAEQGGFYQALAKGYYDQLGLNVQIRQGGPGVDLQQLIAAGAVDLSIAPNGFMPLNLVEVGAPVVAVAAFFQKDPLVLIAHATSAASTLEDLKGKPLMLSKTSISTFWRWMKAKYDFKDEQVRPYAFSTAPFATNPEAIQQGYVTAEPYKIKKEADLDTKVFVLADAGYKTYAGIILAQNKLVSQNPQAVQNFVNASIRGWYDYLYGDPTPGNDLIKKDNPDMDDGAIADAISKMKEFGIVDSGDSKSLGIGVMTQERWKAFFDDMVSSGIYPASLDYKQAFTTRFLDKDYALSMRSDKSK